MLRVQKVGRCDPQQGLPKYSSSLPRASNIFIEQTKSYLKDSLGVDVQVIAASSTPGSGCLAVHQSLPLCSHATNNTGNIAKCPFMNAEHQLIKEKHRALASNGCTRDICQAGRAIHTDESRVGENRSLESVCQDADDFLRDLYDEGFFPNEKALEARLQAVHAEILYCAIEGVAKGTRYKYDSAGTGRKRMRNSSLDSGEHG